MSDETLLRLSWILAGIFFAIAIVSFLGEILCWWNDLGEIVRSGSWTSREYGREAVRIGMTVGTLAGLAISIGAAYHGAGQRQVETIHGTVEDNNEVLQDNNEILQDNNDLLQDNNEVLRESNSKLDQLEKLEQLDRQVDLLQGIHDRLSGCPVSDTAGWALQGERGEGRAQARGGSASDRRSA